MNTNDMIDEIRDTNLNYLMLTQQLIRADRAGAIFRLGLCAEVADLLESLTNAQLIKLAATPMMLVRFRFDDPALLATLTSCHKDRMLAHAHTAIVLTSQSIETIR